MAVVFFLEVRRPRAGGGFIGSGSHLILLRGEGRRAPGGGFSRFALNFLR